MISNKLKYAFVVILSLLTYWFFPVIIPRFVPISDLLIRIAKLIVGPMIFIGVINSLIQIKTFKQNFNIIRLVFVFSVLLTLVSILLGISLGSSFNLLPELSVIENQLSKIPYNKTISLTEMLKTTIPTDIFNTITSTKILPIFLLSLLFGTAINTSKKSVQFLNQLFDHIYTILITISSGIKSLLYIPIYFILTVNLNKLTLDFLIQLNSFFLTFISGIAILSLIVLPYLTYIMTGTSPIQLVKKSYIPLLTGFATMSSAITYPITFVTLINKHKLNQHISTISLSLGTTLNMTGTAFYQILLVIFSSQFFDIQLTVMMLFKVSIITLLISLCTAAIPGGGIMTLIVILNMVNIPLEGIAILLVIDPFCDQFRTMVNVWSNICLTKIINHKSISV